jgi:hypothetical protein
MFTILTAAFWVRKLILVPPYLSALETSFPRTVNAVLRSHGPQMKKYKLVFLGEQSVGKTSLITRFASRA